MENEKYKNLDDLKCIWMSSNLVKYKLCNRNFDCDNCIFDKVMKNEKIDESYFNSQYSSLNENILEKTVNSVKELTYHNNFIYLKNHLVLKNLFGNTYYMGLSPLAHLILKDIPGFNYCKDGLSVQKGFPIAQFLGSWGSYKIDSPLNFFCLGRLKQEITNHYTGEWFLLIETYPDEIESFRLYEEEFKEDQFFVEKFISRKNNEFKHLGITMNDGGLGVDQLSKSLGNEKYYYILDYLFSRKEKDLTE